MSLTNIEIELLDEMLGDEYSIVTEIPGKCFVLSLYGTYAYNECFTKTDDPYFMKQKYELLTPVKMICFNNYFYLMEAKEDVGIWYRGVLNSNGNYKFDCYADSLEEIIYSL